jgi:hypothetical protein
MKRLAGLLLLFSLALSSCGSGGSIIANTMDHWLEQDGDLFLTCVNEMEAFGEERCYVAMEEPKKEEAEAEETLSETTEFPKEKRLVFYEKESGDRTEIENEALQTLLERYGFQLIFFQTASDSRRCVIFSFCKETAEGVHKGLYYSYDALPCAWWGRRAELVKQDGRYLQMQKNGTAWYTTSLLRDHFYYYEKAGALTA